MNSRMREGAKGGGGIKYSKKWKEREREREGEGGEMIAGPSSFCIPKVLKLQTCEQPNDTFQMEMC